MGWKHYQTVDHPKWEPQAGRGLFNIHLLILHFKFQFSKSIKSLIFHIFLNLTYSLRKNLFPKMSKNLFPKMSKNHSKIYKKPPNGGYGNKQEVLALLKTWPRYWQKSRVKRRQNSLHVYPRLNTGLKCLTEKQITGTDPYLKPIKRVALWVRDWHFKTR